VSLSRRDFFQTNASLLSLGGGTRRGTTYTLDTE
jgi:hypothetical protein